MLKRIIKIDPDRMTGVRFDLSWRLVAALASGLVLGSTGAVTWAYNYGNKLVAISDTHRTTALTAYPTWPQVLQVFREERQMMNQANETRHAEVMKRLDRIEDRLK